MYHKLMILSIFKTKLMNTCIDQVDGTRKWGSIFLLSDGAGYITGRNIRVDGGITRSV